MLKLNSYQIRTKFLDFFQKNNHTYVASSSLIPYNDPSLIFVNSGMVQFKNVFTGIETRTYSKATSNQKSIRAGGKHNDLNKVGYTARHHTFFEMLGNFSFGDYFKEEAIYYAWQLLTDIFKIPKEKLYVTVYYNDKESAILWKKIAGFDNNHIISVKSHDNFWSMGNTGPCGPCTEIFYDHGEKIAGGLPGTTEEEGDRFIEIWNIVFMEYLQVDTNKIIQLPKKSVDTGMGLERISAVIEGVSSNYDIDLFKTIIATAESIIKIPYKADTIYPYRVISDHLRAIAFIIADGVMPAKEGRGYVLRRIIRRAIGHVHQLKVTQPLLYKLIPTITDLYIDPFPELKKNEESIISIIKQEEVNFQFTLEKGLNLLKKETVNAEKNSKFSGEIAFKLHDTFGFPLDMTEEILKTKGITIDIDMFNKKMEEQKNKARKSWIGSGDLKTNNIWYSIINKFGRSEYLGYKKLKSKGIVQALVKNNSIVTEINEKNDIFTLISNQTPFYAESGGQIGDIGIITSIKCKITVTNTIKYLGKLHAHICQLQEGSISENDNIVLTVDNKSHQKLKANHSATHILHATLKNILGKHVTQKGSLITENKLRFDINHPVPLTEELIQLIEEKVNEVIYNNSKIEIKLMSINEAIASGAIALFSEKYQTEVRVIYITKDNTPYSIELCGGTHVNRTGEIGIFKIINTNTIAAGIRRIEAVCGKNAIEYINNNEKLLNKIAIILKTNKKDIIETIISIQNSKNELLKNLKQTQKNIIYISEHDINKNAIIINKIRIIYKEIANIDLQNIRHTSEKIIRQYDDLILIYINKLKSNFFLIISISYKMANKYHAGNIAKQILSIIDGKGGGTSKIAQINSNKIDQLPILKKKIITLISQI